MKLACTVLAIFAIVAGPAHGQTAAPKPEPTPAPSSSDRSSPSPRTTPQPGQGPATRRSGAAEDKDTSKQPDRPRTEFRR